MSLSWSPATDDVGVVGYRVTRNGAWSASPSGLTWKDTARAPLTTYTYAVAALDAVGHVGSVATITVRTRADTVRPTTPKDFHKVRRSGAYVAFDWSPSTDNVHVAKYYVYRVGRSKPVAVSEGVEDPHPHRAWREVLRAGRRRVGQPELPVREGPRPPVALAARGPDRADPG